MPTEMVPGVRHLLDLAADFSRAGGQIDALPALSETLSWPDRRDQIRQRVQQLRAAVDLPPEGLPDSGGGASPRQRALSAAIDQIDSGKQGFVARMGDDIVGIAAASWPRSGLLELDWLGTKPGQRGAGAALIAAVVRSWPTPTALRLRTAFSSHDYYLTLGFQPQGEDRMVLAQPRTAAIREGLGVPPAPTLDRGL